MLQFINNTKNPLSQSKKNVRYVRANGVEIESGRDGFFGTTYGYTDYSIEGREVRAYADSNALGYKLVLLY